MENFPNYPPAVREKILNGPALTPPKGVISNFDNPSNHNTTALSVAVVCISLALVAALLRGYSRLFVAKKLHLEDYIALAAFVGLTGKARLLTGATKLIPSTKGFYGGFLWTYFSFYTICGFFVHQWDIQVKTLFEVSYVVIILPILYASFMLLIKPAILLEWTRIFVPQGQHNTFFWTARMLILANVLLYMSGIIAESLACIPLEKLWHKWLPGKCIDRKVLESASAAFNLVIDIFILILPQRVIWNLQMTKNKKIGISVVFSIGLLACVCAAGRLYACITQSYGGTGDGTYTLGRTFLWAMAETTCVLLVFCIPAIPKAFKNGQKGFFSHLAQSLRSWTRINVFGSRRKSDANDLSWLPSEQDSLQQRSIVSGNKTHQYTAQMGTASLEDVYLVQPAATQSSADVLHAGEAEQPAHGSGILRTTEVVQKKEKIFQSEAYGRSESPYVEHQQSWIQR